MENGTWCIVVLASINFRYVYQGCFTRKRNWGAFAASFAFAISVPVAVVAQAIELNPATIETGRQLNTLPDGGSGLASDSSDETPLGVDLAGIRLISSPSQVAKPSATRPGIETIDLPLVSGEVGDSLLETYLGRPVSFKLITDIRVSVTQFYRDKDRSLVAVLVPPQEITSGVLQLVVVPFRAGRIEFEGNQWTSDRHLERSVRQSAGKPVDSGQLIDDLNWLNLNPYRDVTAIFEPGNKPGETNLTLRSRELKPWGIFSGYSNTGSPSNDTNRFFFGFNRANLPAIDHQLSFQLTVSPDYIISDGQWFSDPSDAAYFSPSMAYFVPLPWRHKLNFQVAYVRSNTNPAGGVFRQQSETTLLYGEYGVPLPRKGGFASEVYGGLEYDGQSTENRFLGSVIGQTELDILQGSLGWRGQVTDRFGWTGFDFSAAFSPGGLSSSSAFVAASGDPNARASFGYLNGRLNRLTRLYQSGWTVSSLATGQWSPRTLPGIKQFTIGGWNSVRGYQTTEAAGDVGFTLSTEIRSPSFSVLSNFGRASSDAITAYAFWDHGFAHEYFDDNSHTLSSVGLGMDLTYNNRLSGSVAWGLALTDGPETSKGESRIQGRITLRY